MNCTFFLESPKIRETFLRLLSPSCLPQTPLFFCARIAMALGSKIPDLQLEITTKSGSTWFFDMLLLMQRFLHNIHTPEPIEMPLAHQRSKRISLLQKSSNGLAFYYLGTTAVLATFSVSLWLWGALKKPSTSKTVKKALPMFLMRACLKLGLFPSRSTTLR